MSDWTFSKLFQQGSDDTPYRKITSDFVSTLEVDGRTILKVEDEGLELLAKEAMADIAHLLRPGHLRNRAATIPLTGKSHPTLFPPLRWMAAPS